MRHVFRTVTIVVAHDQPIFRNGLRRLLETVPHFRVVGEAGNADELILKVRSYKPDVAVVDVRMPPTQTDEGARAAQTIREEQPEVGVLMLSQVVEARDALRLFGEHPDGFGYLLKDRVLEVDDFVDAVKRVGRGGTARWILRSSRSSSAGIAPTKRSRSSQSRSSRLVCTAVTRRICCNTP